MTPDPELCFFITWHRLRSGCALLIYFNTFGIMLSVLLVASERIIPAYFELTLNTATTTRCLVYCRVVEVGKNYFF